MDISAFLAFFIAATVLLGTPGPAIAALVASGRQHGIAGSARLFWSIQAGLALAGAVTALGLAGLLLAYRPLAQLLQLAAAGYLLWLAWHIAAAPVPAKQKAGQAARPIVEGFLLGTANPKAYLALVTLFSMKAVLPAAPGADLVVKWTAFLSVAFAVDTVWLIAGSMLGRAPLGERRERLLNRALGGAIALVAVYTLLGG